MLFLVFRRIGISYQKILLSALSFVAVLLFSRQAFVGFVAIVLSNMFLARCMSRYQSYWCFFAGLVFNLGLLFCLKIFQFSHKSFVIYLVGLSFYSLQNIAYLHQIYLKQIDFKISDYLFYISYFPKFLSGPIEDYNTFTSGLKRPDLIDFKQGLARILLGLLKKIVIADRLAACLIIYGGYESPLPGATELISAVMYTFQLYFDFSAYIDIMIGVSLLLGVQLSENFNLPFRATGILDFWQRWHMSLMNWLRQYIYYPLAFRYRNQPHVSIFISVLLLFVFSALWHGLGLNYLFWAGIHAFFVILEAYWPKRVNTSHWLFRVPAVLYTFSIVVFANVFFQATALSDAFLKIQKICSSPFMIEDYVVELVAPFQGGGMPFDVFNFKITLMLVLFFVLFERMIQRIFQQEKYLFVTSLLSILLLLFFGRFMDTQSFIYAQF